MTLHRRIGLALLLLIPFLSAVGAEEPSAPPPDAYRLFPGDVIEVSVKEDPELDRVLVVPGDGFVLFRPLGRLMLLEKSLDEVADEIRQKLAQQNYVTTPTVYCVIRSYAPRKVYLWGAVPRAIEIDPVRPLTLVQVLATASVSPERVDLSRVEIRRTLEGREPYRFTIDVDALERDGKYEKDVRVMAGDIITVPALDRRAGLATVSILGKVNKPGRYSYDRSRERITLLGLIADAGGLHQYAKQSGIRILSETGGPTKITRVDYDEILDGEIVNPELEPGDIVFVPESFW